MNTAFANQTDKPLLAQNNPAGAEARKAIVTPIFTATNESFQNLAARWQDEKEHEDFKEYSKIMQGWVLPKCPTGTTFVRAHKSPFGITVRIPGFPYDVQFNASGWKSTKAR